MFRPVQSHVSFPSLEADILKFWKEAKTYERSLEHRAGTPKFVFYEGPPTANGLPHPGHCLTRAIKDLYPRYRTMRGYLCQRKAGWDTHGLPVEVEVCKELGIHSKEDIENYGVEPFIHRCQQSVWRYMQEWENLTERIGFWIDLNDAYVTYHQSYIESVWASLKELFNRGLLYRGHKIVWWWAQGGTALSAGEVGLGYREVADPSVYVLFPVLDAEGKDRGLDLVVWTTTPWTLPSNQFAAVHPELDYAVVEDPEHGRRLIIAAALVETVAGKLKRELKVVETIKGAAIVGWRYLPPFRYYYGQRGDDQGELLGGGRQHLQWRVVAADFVTIDSGTGVVHQAPAFGEVDFKLLRDEQARFTDAARPELICAVAPDGKFNMDPPPEGFTDEAPDLRGRWVKEADKDITRNLRHRGLLYHQEQYLHEYPFCWRAEEDPLIQYPRESWFIRTTSFKDEMLKNNRQINWMPEHIRDGRMGKFLESNVDWALSRERYWGTPLPIWSDGGAHTEAIGSYAELLSKPGVEGLDAWEEAKRKQPELVDDLKVHKPYIDRVTYLSPDGTRMTRVPEVIDCWYDSGAMPFAQWGYPHQGREKFKDQFPADFISEALDQTRGWFYSQLAIATLLFRDQDSKRLRLALQVAADAVSQLHRARADARRRRAENLEAESGTIASPHEIFDLYGADALRWYFFANQPPWTSIRYSERAIKESIPEFLLRLWHVYSFFVIYATIDGFDPAAELHGDAGELEPPVLAREKISADRPAQRARSLDPQRVASHGGGSDRADG